MIASGNHRPPGLGASLGRFIHAGLGSLRLRAELFAVEWQEERLRMTEIMLFGFTLALFAMLGLLLFTAIIIFLFPPEFRLYVAGAFTVIYWAAAIGAWLGLRSRLARQPFTETIDQTRKDVQCLAPSD